jgi:ketosteroid isomerase-like protein
MVRRRVCAVAAVLVLTALLAACGESPEPGDEEAVLTTLRNYREAVAAYDADAAMALFTDDYEGLRGTGKEGVGRLVEMMGQREGTYELDLTDAVVKFDGDTARVTGARAQVGRWEIEPVFVLVRTDGGWRISAIERQR